MKTYKTDKYLNKQLNIQLGYIDKHGERIPKKKQKYKRISKLTRRLMRKQLKDAIYKKLHPVAVKKGA